MKKYLIEFEDDEAWNEYVDTIPRRIDINTDLVKLIKEETQRRKNDKRS